MVVLHGCTHTYETYNFAMFSLQDSNLLFCTVIMHFIISFTSLLCRPNEIDLSLLCTMANQFERQIYNKKTSSVNTEKPRRCFAVATSRLGRWATKRFSHSSLNPATIRLKHNNGILNRIIQICPSTWHWWGPRLQGQENFVFPKRSRSNVWSTQPLFKWLPGFWHEVKAARTCSWPRISN